MKVYNIIPCFKTFVFHLLMLELVHTGRMDQLIFKMRNKIISFNGNSKMSNKLLKYLKI